MMISKVVRCPECNAHLEDTGYVLASNPPYTAVKCSSNRCEWKGYVHQSGLVGEDFKTVEEI